LKQLKIHGVDMEQATGNDHRLRSAPLHGNSIAVDLYRSMQTITNGNIA